MASHFRVFRTGVTFAVPNIGTMVPACCVLHNYLGHKSHVDQEEVVSGQIILGIWCSGGHHQIPL
jgi:hypothetical protein